MCEAAVFICHLLGITSLTEGTMDSASKENNAITVDTGLEKLIESMHNIYKVTQQRNELKAYFVKSILPAVLQLKYNFRQSEAFQNLFEELVITEDCTLVCEAFKSETRRKIQSHLKALANLMTKNEEKCDIVTLNSLLFDVYVQSCLKNSKHEPNHLPMFYILISVAGFPLQLPYNTLVNPLVVGSQRLLVLKELLGVLQKHNIPVSSESEEGVLSMSLVLIEKEILSEQWPISVELLQTLQVIFTVYPESVRLVFSEFANQIIFLEKSNSKIIKCYNHLLISIVKSFSDLNQLDKFFALFFHKAVLAWKDSRLSQLTIGMLVTKGVFTVLSDKLSSLTGNQLKTIIGRIDHTFSKELVSQLEDTNSADCNLRLFSEITVKVLCHILENACIVMPTRWNILSNEVKAVAVTVQRFGCAILEVKEIDSLLLGFLQLVRVFIDIELALNHYTVSLAAEQIVPRVNKSKEKCHSVHDLCKSHGFLAESDWKRISRVVEESHNIQLKHAWLDLLIQKFVRSGDTEVVTHLSIHSDGDWLWSSITNMAGSVPLEHLELYADLLLAPDTIMSGNFTDKLATLQNIDVFSNRLLRMVLNLQALKHISKALSENGDLSKKMVKLIDIHSVLKYEAEILQTETPPEMNVMVEASANILNKCLWDKTPICLSESQKVYLARLIDIITVMNSHCLKAETKRIICLSLMGLAYDLRGEDILLQNVLEVVLGCLDDGGSVISDALDGGVLVYWLVVVVPTTYPLRHSLTRLAITKVFHRLEKCVDGMSQVVPRGDSVLLCAITETLVQAHVNNVLKDMEEYQKLAKRLISMSSSMFGKKIKEKFLRLYTASLKLEYVFFKDQIQTILENLSGYLDILFSKFAKNSVVEPNATELIDLTLSLKSHVDADIVKKVNTSITSELSKIDLCPLLCYPTTVRVFLESLSTQDFEQSFNEICKKQLEALSSDSAGQSTLSNFCDLWTIVVTARLDKDKAKLRQKLLISTLGHCHSLLERDPLKVHPSLVKLLHTVVVSKSIILAPKLFDLILVILEGLPTDTESYLLPESLSVLDSLVNVRPEILFDRIPAFLQRLRKFIKSLVLLASAENSDMLVFSSVSTASVNHVTRIMKTMTDQHSKHFARISPYLISDMLNFLVSHSIESSIKTELQNCVCILLTICDHRGTQLLQSLLPLPATELFKVLSVTFNKTYKYTGKV